MHLADIESGRHWYRVTHERSTSGSKGGRIYVVDCSACSFSETFHPHSQSDDAMRKRVLRRGWELGRRIGQHLCANCVAKQRVKAAEVQLSPPPPKATIPFLEEAWLEVSESERIAFIAFLKKQISLEDHPPAVLIIPLQEAWEKASAEEREELIKYCIPMPPPQPIPPLAEAWWRATARERAILTTNVLAEGWDAASKEQREKFLRWLDQTRAIAPLSLIEYWERATEADRQQLLRYLRPTKQYKAEVHTRRSGKPPEGAIRKSDLAVELSLPSSTISTYVREGLPVRADGYLDKEVAIEWIEERRSRTRPVARWRPPKDDAPPPEAQNNFALDDDEAFREMNKRIFGD